MKPKNPLLLKKVALDALLEMINDEDYATHQHHSDPDFTTQNGKMMGKGTEVEDGALNAAVPGRLLARRRATVGAQPVRVMPVEPVIDDATFFKESEDEFEVTKSATGQIIVAETKSYGAGTPIGGTPNANPNATPTSAPTTPQQLAQNTEQNAMQENQQQQPQPQQGQTPSIPQPGQQPLVPGQQPPPGSPQDALSQLYQMTAAFFVENAAISIKESPKMLPPRDDMRRHIDETAKAEVMQGVNEPAPAPAAPTGQPAAAPTAPMQNSQPAMTSQQKLLNTALASVQTEEFVNLVCPGCHGQSINKLQDSGLEDGELAECNDCGCFFSL
jgi:hypothetical protein